MINLLKKERNGKIGCGGCLALVVLVPVVVIALIAVSNPRVPGPAANVPAPPAEASSRFRPGDEVQIVNDHGAETVAILADGAFIHLPNPTRVRITDGRLRTRNGAPLGYEVEVLDGEYTGTKGVAGVNALRK